MQKSIIFQMFQKTVILCNFNALASTLASHDDDFRLSILGHFFHLGASLTALRCLAVYDMHLTDSEEFSCLSLWVPFDLGFCK